MNTSLALSPCMERWEAEHREIRQSSANRQSRAGDRSGSGSAKADVIVNSVMTLGFHTQQVAET